ncbi:Hint domain-containing protein [Acidisphaera sp. L21]|uniref:Hint domain-containing protein n=1 Tax=Acidisphaera sp. L21 TaxID=1641851 RepID=UPI00131C3129|nr:Hint domain-containing protein [Acidisphaera sp. L21]
MANSSVPTLTAFTSGNLVISISGDGDGSGTYGDNQGSPLTLQEVTTAGVILGQLVLPQTTTVVNGTTEYAFSAEYGSSSEGLLQLSADGQSLTVAGYAVNAATYNAGGTAVYGNAALAQTTSLSTATTVTPVARLLADISYNGTIDTSTALFNVDDTNNPRSVATINGTSFYLSGQGVKGDTTQGVFLAQDGANAATAIDTSTDTRAVEFANGQLYVSRDSKQGTGGGTSDIATYGTTLPTSATTATILPGIDGTLTLTAAQANSVNGSAVGKTVNLSPESYFFANATTLYVADGGNPKAGGLGDGGLQKWVLSGGTWTLAYTLSAGLNLVPDTAASGTTGLIGLTGVVVGNSVQLYATNSTVGDLDQTFLYGITDSLSATTLPAAENFTALVTAAPDTNIRGVSFAPSASAAAPTTITVVSGTPQSNVTVTSGSTLTVQAGGVVTNATILSGGTAVVSSGGVASGGTIAHGATETVLGSAAGAQVDGTQIVSAATAVVSNETVYNGGAVDLFLKGAAANGLTLTNGGALNISGNATATNTIIGSGGVINLQSPKAVLSGSVAFAGPGAINAAVIVSAGFGDLAVISGFAAGDVIDQSTIAAGATLSTAVVSGNTVATITSGATTQSYIFGGTTIGSSLALVSDGAGGEEITIGSATTAPAATTVSSGMSVSNVTVPSGATLTVQSGGAITSSTILSGGMAVVSGTDANSIISAGGTETVLGSATGDKVFGTQIVSAATAVVSNETVFNGGAVDLFLKGAVASGVTISSGGTLNISGNATATNTVLVNGGVVDLQSPKAVLSGSLTFSGAGTLRESAVVSFGFGDFAVISGFAAGDSVDLTAIASGATLTSTVVGGNTVETVNSGTTSESFMFAGTYVAGYFNLAPDSATGVAITAVGTPCYCPGTQILTDHGEVAVEDLHIGDTIITHQGTARPIRWIGRRAYDGRFAAGQKQILPIVISANALADGQPRCDLMVSPLHAMFIDGVLIPASALVNGTSIVQVQNVETVEYIHIELATHDVIVANGAPSESFIDDHSRFMFHNAADYRALYPDATQQPVRYCAPRVEDGDLVEAVRRRLSARVSAATAIAGRLDGHIDGATRSRVYGWARDEAGEAVRLRVSANDVVICEVKADQYRADLADAGLGDGRYAFDVVIPGGLPADGTVIRVQRVSDGAILAERRCA